MFTSRVVKNTGPEEQDFKDEINKYKNGGKS
jgi:hypothetical protein